MSEARTKILVADDNPLVRAGIGVLLSAHSNFELVGETGDGRQVFELSRKRKAQVLILGLSLNGQSTQETLTSIRKEKSQLKVILLVANHQDIKVSHLIPLGVDGCLLMAESTDSLVIALNAITCGGVWFSQSMVKLLVRSSGLIGIGSTPMGLTARESEVLQLISAGADNSQIASSLGLSIQTIKNYVSRLYSKLNVQSRVQAIFWARDHGVGENTELVRCVIFYIFE